MGNEAQPILLPFLTLLFILLTNFSPATSTNTTLSKDQIACTMCSACDNPCQPLPSPPPPSPPPPSSANDCPPPPAPPPPSSLSDCPPPPPSEPVYVPPPPGGATGGIFYPPPNYYNYPTPPPPNPIVPYFPFYYYNPPPSSFISHSVPLKNHPIVSSIFVFLIFLT